MAFTTVKTAREITAMRTSGKMLATVLQLLKTKVSPGITTKELADIAASELKALGGEPAILGYNGFPDVICISLNDEVVHGIPSVNRIVHDGDIVSLDFCVAVEGLITDAALSVVAGTTKTKKVTTLLTTTEESLNAGINSVKNTIKVGSISAAIEKVLKTQRYGIVRDLVGHGVGHEMHEEPNIPNYGKAGKGPVLRSGMTIAIEPMATLGSERVYLDRDGWTIKTWDGSWSAHFEHTILITNTGAEVLTTL
jgi:methionyl aminopeptidase